MKKLIYIGWLESGYVLAAGLEIQFQVGVPVEVPEAASVSLLASGVWCLAGAKESEPAVERAAAISKAKAEAKAAEEAKAKAESVPKKGTAKKD